MIFEDNKMDKIKQEYPEDNRHHKEHPEHQDKPHHPVDHGCPNHHDRPEEPITVIINGTDKILPVGTRCLSYEDVVKLAYGKYDGASNIIYTVAYSNGPEENKKGVLVKGDTVFIKGGMIFNVGCSNKS